MTTTVEPIDHEAWREAERIVSRAERDMLAARYAANFRWQSIIADVQRKSGAVEAVSGPAVRTIAQVYADVRRAKVNEAKRQADALTKVNALDEAATRAGQSLARAREASRVSSLAYEEAVSALADARPLERESVRAEIEARRKKRDTDIATMLTAKEVVREAQIALHEAQAEQHDANHLRHISGRYA